jgi:hypothetical protein
VYVRAEDNVALPGKISKRRAMHDAINAIGQVLQLTSIQAESGQAYIAPDGGYSRHIEIRLPKQTGYRRRIQASQKRLTDHPGSARQENVRLLFS